MATATTKRTPARRRSGAARKTSALGSIEVPERLEEFLKSAQKRLDEVERDLYRAGAKVRRNGVRVLREVSHELGKIEQRGEAEWRRLRTRYGREAVKILQRIEKAVAPPARKRTTKKRPSRTSQAAARA